jgi:hypothetical protein
VSPQNLILFAPLIIVGVVGVLGLIGYLAACAAAGRWLSLSEWL